MKIWLTPREQANLHTTVMQARCLLSPLIAAAAVREGTVVVRAPQAMLKAFSGAGHRGARTLSRCRLRQGGCSR